MKWLPGVASVFCLFTTGAIGIYAAPTVGVTAASPTVIVIGQPTTVTVTSLITDPSLIPTGVNLLRLNATGPATILGQLHDDGLNGDAVAGDKIYTLQVTFNEAAAGTIRLQVSAPFKGVLQRVLSNVMTVTVAAPPTITGSVNKHPNAAGWNNSDVTVTFTCSDAASGIASCTPPVTVSTEGRAITVTGTAINNAGISANASVDVNIDKTPPALAIQSPAVNASLFAPQTSVSGTVSDVLSGLSAVSCNGAAAVVSKGSFLCTVALTTGGNAITVQATDAAGNVANASVNVMVLPAPLVTFSAPANLSFVNTTPITVRGTVSDPAASVTVNGIAAPQAAGNFSVTVPLNEGSNTLTAVAQNAAGNAGTASVTVTLDTTPPHVTIDSPSANAITTESTVTVSGTVNDIVVGTVNDQDAQVTVNGIAAQVANRSYAAVNVPLALGANTIQVVARDRVGNAATASINLTRQSLSQPPQPAIGQAVISESLTIVSGNNQTGAIATPLAAPLVVALRDSSNSPVVNQVVVFKVTGNNGTVNGAPAAAVNTDSNGQAQVAWTLGTRSGAGINTVQASSVLASASANFSATASTGSPALVVVDSGDAQSGVAGQPLPFPLVAVVTDAGSNRVANVPVTFSVVAGGGNLGGLQSQIINTDSDGRVLAVLTLGPQAGNGNNAVQVSFPGYAGSAPAFTASAKIPGNPANTTITGAVLDNGGAPIPGVTMRLFLANQGNLNNLPQQIGTPVITDAQGQFLIPLSASGFFKLMADGSTATGSSSYPTLEYDIVPVPGQSNNVGTPIYLPALDTVNKLCVDETHGGTLTLPQSPGFALTVQPGAATFPGGARQGCISVTPVHGDKVPMPPGFGQQPRFIVTIQPVGTTFNPPAAITLPNADGLPPNAVTEMYSYDHDLSMFVAIGTGTVSDDGSVIVSNPGGGVLKAGWHCGGNPNKKGTVAKCGPCESAQGDQCQADPQKTNPNNPASCNDSQQDFDVSVGGGAQKVHVFVADSCRGACVANNGRGVCMPKNGTGFNITQASDNAQLALSKLFDNSPEACIESGLRTAMQNKVLKTGLVIFCSPDDPNQNQLCAIDTGSNNMSLKPGAFNGSNCPQMAATILHEMVHGLAQDHGAPDVTYHNFGPVPDCRDRPYGCEENCFPGSTGGTGNPFACFETQDFMTQQIQAGHGEGVGCQPCKSVNFFDEQHVLHTETACATILPQ